jgi:hypothetical protein
MNNTEEKYSLHLERRKMDGDVLWWRFEGVKLRLADSTFYSPDFAVMRSTGQIELHEIKGFMMDDANVKIKVAADQYPFTFYIVRKGKGGIWNMAPVPSRVSETANPEGS